MATTMIEKRRAEGKKWEREFCKMAARLGKSFTPMQLGRPGSIMAFRRQQGEWRRFTLPDIAIWTCPGEHHEIKNKNPTRRMEFGLEVYRFRALLWFANETQQDVMYSIHDWEKAGGKDKPNSIEHWITASVLNLNERWNYKTDKFGSIVNGKWKDGVAQYFWSVDLWAPLAEHWNVT